MQQRLRFMCSRDHTLLVKNDICIQYSPVHTSNYVTCQARHYQKLQPCSNPLQNLFYQRSRRILMTPSQGRSSSQGWDSKSWSMPKAPQTSLYLLLLFGEDILVKCQASVKRTMWLQHRCGPEYYEKSCGSTEIFGSALSLLQEKNIVPS